MEIGKKILKYRKKMDLSQEMLGEKINVSRQTISNWESGETYPNSEQLKLLSQVFKVSIDELVDNDIKNVFVERSIKTEKMVSIILRLLVVIIITIFVVLGITYINKISGRGELVEETIVCNLYGEEHSFRIKYYEFNDEVKEFGRDLYFDNILNLSRYNSASKIFNIINDYVKKNGGTCANIVGKDLNNLVNIYFKEDTLTNTGGIVIIEDKCPNKIIYGSSFWIERYNNGNWERLESKNDYGFTLMAYYVDENGILEMEQNWDYIYGPLDKGTYRLVKDVSFDADTPITKDDIYYIWVEFEID